MPQSANLHYGGRSSGCRLRRADCGRYSHPAHILQPREVLIGIEDVNKPRLFPCCAPYWLDVTIFQACDPNQIPFFRRRKTAHPNTDGKNRFPYGGRLSFRYWRADAKTSVRLMPLNAPWLTANRSQNASSPLTGEAVSRPGNVWARLGTPVRHLLNDAGFCPSADQMVIMGGPLMGIHPFPRLDVPGRKITNLLLAPSVTEMGRASGREKLYCCSACADALPC